MATKLHKQRYIRNYKGHGGTTMNTTLCGRMADSQWDKFDGMNIAEKDSDVTCKLCLREMKLKKDLEET